jgi:hypothetical protein
VQLRALFIGVFVANAFLAGSSKTSISALFVAMLPIYGGMNSTLLSAMVQVKTFNVS